MCVAGRTRESPIPGSTRGERGSALWLSLSLLLYRLGLDRQRPAFLAVMMVGMYLKVAPEIRRALQGGRPVGALESTIITHGMPYPENLETARSLESQVRAGGAVQATIAVIGGVICAGLSDTELEWLATAKNVLKLSRNDLPYALATKKIGATTVAATMICAHLAGIKVFATGGIGGVHAGADASFDILGGGQPLQFGIGKTGANPPANHRDSGRHRASGPHLALQRPRGLQVLRVWHSVGNDGALQRHHRTPALQRPANFRSNLQVHSYHHDSKKGGALLVQPEPVE